MSEKHLRFFKCEPRYKSIISLTSHLKTFRSFAYILSQISSHKYKGEEEEGEEEEETDKEKVEEKEEDLQNQRQQQQ